MNKLVVTDFVEKWEESFWFFLTSWKVLEVSISGTLLWSELLSWRLWFRNALKEKGLPFTKLTLMWTDDHYMELWLAITSFTGGHPPKPPCYLSLITFGGGKNITSLFYSVIPSLRAFPWSLFCRVERVDGNKVRELAPWWPLPLKPLQARYAYWISLWWFFFFSIHLWVDAIKDS